MSQKQNVQDLLASPESEQRSRGYFDTLREILQQPATWLDTCERMIANAAMLEPATHGIRMLALTGSGSSEFAGHCVRLVLQNELGVAAEAVGAGTLLTHGKAALPPERPSLVVSLARSGDSPESVAVVDLLLDAEPALRHLVITCNKAGKLATTYRGNARVQAIVLDDRTNDRSLAMTSSFTNMALAARFLGMLGAPERYRALCERLSGACSALLEKQVDALAAAAGTGFARAVFLGSGSRLGAARESALKMLEMTAGRVGTMWETYLGLRHGPMSYVHGDTLLVCFLSSDPGLRAYEADLIRELDRKRLGLAKVIVGNGIPAELWRERDTAIECPGLAEIGDEDAAVLDVVVGQCLATFRCLQEGLRPDAPSDSGVINRVVESFPVHRAAGRAQ
jgi:tagatose-6-phosphate ketose/aldose isomerase